MEREFTISNSFYDDEYCYKIVHLSPKSSLPYKVMIDEIKNTRKLDSLHMRNLGLDDKEWKFCTVLNKANNFAIKKKLQKDCKNGANGVSLKISK